jgi:hypothetical protein
VYYWIARVLGFNPTNHAIKYPSDHELCHHTDDVTQPQQSCDPSIIEWHNLFKPSPVQFAPAAAAWTETY